MADTWQWIRKHPQNIIRKHNIKYYYKESVFTVLMQPMFLTASKVLFRSPSYGHSYFWSLHVNDLMYGNDVKIETFSCDLINTLTVDS